MTVFVMDNTPEGIRGELTRWFLELKPGVFVGNVNARIRDLLWDRIGKGKSGDGAVMVYQANNEQGFSMKLCGEPKREVVDFEGVQLIKVVSDREEKNAEEGVLLPGFSYPLELLEE